MKTPMQELIEQIKQLKYSEINEQAWDAYDSVMDIAEAMLEKEKRVMCKFAEDFAVCCFDTYCEQTDSVENHYNETFNNK